MGPCGTASCLHIADIGDNDASRDRVTIYRLPEPEGASGSAAATDSFHATYPDGPHDAEALLIDGNGRLYIVTKGETGPIGRRDDEPRTVCEQQRDSAARLRHVPAAMEVDNREAEHGGGRRRLCHCRNRQCDETGKDDETGLHEPVRSCGVQMVRIVIDHVALAIRMKPGAERRNAKAATVQRMSPCSGTEREESTPALSRPGRSTSRALLDLDCSDHARMNRAVIGKRTGVRERTGEGPAWSDRR